MSEYQFYGFRAIDRPLSSSDIKELRRISSRAEITSESFVNVYNYGDLKARPRDLLRRFFDVYVYLANWGTAELMLRLPREALDERLVQSFAADGYFEAELVADFWLLTWSLGESDDYSDFEEDGISWMARLSPLREEILRGDFRSLYIGWLQVAMEEDSAEEVEPMVVEGLNDLTTAQRALAEFLAIDQDLLAAAGTGREARHQEDAAKIDAWLDALPPAVVRDYLRQMLAGQGVQAERSLKRCFAESRGLEDQNTRRSVEELRQLVDVTKKIRLAKEAEVRSKAEAEKRKMRDSFLAYVARDFAGGWKKAHEEAGNSCASAYDRACRLLVDLRDAYALQGTVEIFRREFQQFLAEHGRRKALVSRLEKAGLRQEGM